MKYLDIEYMMYSNFIKLFIVDYRVKMQELENQENKRNVETLIDEIINIHVNNKSCNKGEIDLIVLKFKEILEILNLESLLNLKPLINIKDEEAKIADTLNSINVGDVSELNFTFKQ